MESNYKGNYFKFPTFHRREAIFNKQQIQITDDQGLVHTLQGFSSPVVLNPMGIPESPRELGGKKKFNTVISKSLRTGLRIFFSFFLILKFPKSF